MPSLTVSNQSHASHTYVVTASPQQEGGFPLVIERARVPDQGSANFDLNTPNPYYAYTITSHGKPSHGNSVQVVTKRPIQLGKSSIHFEVQDDIPSLGPENTEGDFQNAFEIVTGSDFNQNDAKKGHWLIGYGNEETAYEAFAPEPNMKYRIQPRTVYYLTPIDIQHGAIVDVTTVGKTVAIDFSQLGDEVSVKHDEKGELIVES